MPITASMSFHKGYKVKFLTQSFVSTDDTKGMYFLGLFVTLLISVITLAAKSLKKTLLKKKSPKSVITLIELIIKLGAGFNMLLLMTFNYGVVACVIVGSALGHILG